MERLTETEMEILICALIEIWMRTDKLMLSDIEQVAAKLDILPELTRRLHDLNDIVQLRKN